MKLVVTKDMIAQKAAATALIEAGIDSIITRLLGSGRAVMFQRYVEEARLLQANPSIPLTDIPLLNEEAINRGLTVIQVAVGVRNKYKKMAEAMATIKKKELQALTQIAAATSPGGLQFVYEIDWEDMYQKAKALL